MKKLALVLCAVLLASFSEAANIIFVSFHAADNTPSAAAATAGFTQAPDVGYTQLLRANGHTVTRYLTRDIPEAAVLNAADLVIISRSVPSGNYELDAETAAWNGITAPTIILGGYILRSSRLGYTTGTTIPDVSSNPVRLTVNNPSHPIFAGIALDGANTMVNPYAHIATYTNNPQRGISVNNNPVAGGGVILATVGTTGDAAFGGMVIGEWQAGATMSTTANGGPSDTLGGHRLVILTGSRESATPALTSEGAGIYDLEPDGARLLLNAVSYMAPSYRNTVLADGPIAYYSFSDTGTTALNSGSLGAPANGTYMNGAVAGPEAPRPPQYVGFSADNTALQMDGVDDFMQGMSGMLNNRPNVTMSAWIRRAGSQRGRTGLLGQNDVIEFGYIDNGTLQAWVDNFSTPINTLTPFPDAEWDHVALVVDGAALQMTTYTNGQVAGTAPLPNSGYGANANPFVVGGDSFGNGVSFNGQMDEAAVFDRALTADQIGKHYYSGVAVPPAIRQQPVGTNAFQGDTVRLSVVAVGTPTLRYQWHYFGGDVVGATGPQLILSNALPEQSGSYSVTVQNAYGSVDSVDVEVNIAPSQPPIISQDPQSITRYAGSTATFTVVALGATSYQWKFEGADISGATSSTLTLNNISAANAGHYRAVASNVSGSTPSAEATLTVLTPPAGSYEAAVVNGHPIAYWRLGELSGTTAYDYVGGNNGTYNNVTLGGSGAIPSDPDTSALFTGNSAVTTPLSLNSTPTFTALGWINRAADQAARTGLWGQNDLVEFGYINNNTLEVWTDNGLDISPNPFPNGEWDFLALVSDGPTIRMYTNGLLAGSRAQTLPANNAFKFNIGGGGIFDATGNFFNGLIDEVAVYNRALTPEQVQSLYFLGSEAPPVITAQPQSTNLFEGGTLRLCVTAVGAPPLTYKWFYFGGEIAGQTSSCLVINNASPVDSGTYQVEVTSPYGTTTSAEALVEVMPANPPIITQHPQSATRYAGGSVTFTGAATGSEPLTYKWQHNGTDVPGATTTTLTLNNLQPADAGQYRLIAMNGLGAATSDPATLTVIAPAAGSYAGAVVAAHPIAYWRLGETSGTTAYDYVGGNNGTYNNVALGVDGAITGDPDKAAGFDGSTSFVDTPVSLNNLPAVTMTGWIRRNGAQANRTGLFGQNDLIEFGYIDNNTIQAWVDNFTSAVNVSPNPIPDQQWGFVALVLDNGNLSVQVNADPDGAVALGSANYGTTPFTFKIGGGGIFDATGNFFNGRIDDVALFNRALSTAELNALYALGANDCPTAADVNVTVAQGSSANFNLSGTDANGDPLSYIVTQPPLHGAVAVNASTGAASYTPAPGYCGPDSFKYKVNDGACDSPEATVHINVVCNRCPVASPSTVTVDQGGSANFNLQASDPDNDPISYIVTQPPLHGALTVNANTGAASYTPAPGYCGPDSFRFKARDTLCGDSPEATVSITVRCLNLPPVNCAASIIPEECTLQMADGTLAVIAVNGADACVVFQGSATDPEGQPLTYSWWTNGVLFALGPVATNCFDVGCHTVAFVSTDPQEASCTTNVTFCVVTASEAVEDCIALVDGANVTRKNLRPLVASLKAAAASFDRGSFTSGLNQLRAFENKVRAQIGKSNPDEAAAFIACVQRIATAIGCATLAGQ